MKQGELLKTAKRIFYILIISSFFQNAFATANRYLHESERLIAASSSTYTVLVSQYEQTPSYTTAYERLYLRVLDNFNNEILSEILLSSHISDREIDESSHINITHTFLSEENPLLGEYIKEPLVIHTSMKTPKESMKIGENGVFIEYEGAKTTVTVDKIKERFSDVNSNVKNKDIILIGWYEIDVKDQTKYFVVVKSGLCDCDLDSYEYVISIDI